MIIILCLFTSYFFMCYFVLTILQGRVKMEDMEKFHTEGDSSIAWFKLSQLVSRGEKEKAHGLYKLLSYSLDDKAYALQVEADLFWAFGGDEAIDKYKQAAFLYKKEQKIVSAAGIYEHLLILNPEGYEIFEFLLECYARLDWLDKIQQRCDALIELSDKGKVGKDKLINIFKLICETYKFDDKKASLKKFITYLKSKGGSIASFAKTL